MAVSIDLHRKVVLVAGGSSGIGLGIARRFEAAGATVHVTGTRAAASDYDADASLDGLDFHSLDVAHDDALRSFSEGFGGLDVLVSSVGTVAHGVNGVAPGFVETKLTRRSREDANAYDETLERIPLGRSQGASPRRWATWPSS